MEQNRQLFIYKLREHRFSPEDIAAAMFAYDLAKRAHRNQLRDTGERFFEHVRGAALILLDEIGTIDINEVIAMLLHDTGEDDGIFGNIKDSYEQFVQTATYRLTKSFNETVARYVIGLTKPHVDGMYFKTKHAMMGYYINGLELDFIVFIQKFCDRLHNLRSLPTENKRKCQNQITETREVLLPAFNRSYKKYQGSSELLRYTLIISKIEHELVRLEKVVASPAA